MPIVLVADHEPAVAEMACRYLERAGMRVLVTHRPEQTLQALAARTADLVIVDLTMPGLEVRGVRQSLAAGAPAVFLLARGDVRPHGLNSPAAARRWLTRPFGPRALVDAAAGMLRPVPQSRATVPAPDPASALAGSLVPALPSGLVPGLAGGPASGLAGAGVRLTRTESVLICALAEQPGRVLSRQRLLSALENTRGKRPSPRAVDVYIAQLRAKLGPDTIRTVHGVGYVLAETPRWAELPLNQANHPET